MQSAPISKGFENMITFCDTTEKVSRPRDYSTTLHKNIVKEIIRECYPAKLKPNAPFITFLTKLLLLDPNWGITDDIMSSRANVQKFVMYVINQLKKENYPGLMTLQMQYSFTCTMANFELMIKEYRRNLKKRLEGLEKSILSFAGTKQDQLEILRKMLVSYLTLITGLGNPKDKWVYEEAELAFTSIVNEEELKTFMKKSMEEKQLELDQLSMITCGIRLFNKDNGKGGCGIEDLAYLLSKSIDAVRFVAESVLTGVMETVNLLTSVIDKFYVIKNLHGEPILELDLYPYMNVDMVEDIKDYLILFRQYEVYVRRILEELKKMESSSETLNVKFNNLLSDINKIVFMKLAVPASLVFPKFVEVAKLWMQMQVDFIKKIYLLRRRCDFLKISAQFFISWSPDPKPKPPPVGTLRKSKDKVVILSNLRGMLDSLKSYEQKSKIQTTLLEGSLGDGNLYTDADRLQRTAQKSIISSNAEVQVFQCSNFQNLDTVKIQYLGFCCWKLVETKGALIPGNPSMGVARYQNRNYVFSTPEGSAIFSRNPEDCIRGVLQLCREKPQLIHLLQIENKLQQVMDVTRLVDEKVMSSKVEDKGVPAIQRWDEIKPAVHDKGYRWNVWDMKREVLMLANLRQLKTVSSQTAKAFSKNTMKNQTCSYKSVDVQTVTDAYTKMAKPMTFIYGLRGRRDDVQFVLDITRPLTK